MSIHRKHKFCAEKVLPDWLSSRIEIFVTYFNFSPTDHHVDHQIENIGEIKRGISWKGNSGLSLDETKHSFYLVIRHFQINLEISFEVNTFGANSLLNKQVVFKIIQIEFHTAACHDDVCGEGEA
jgi:hypothetical protein